MNVYIQDLLRRLLYLFTLFFFVRKKVKKIMILHKEIEAKDMIDLFI